MPRVVLQAGHCHRKTGPVGTRSADGFTEQQFTWATSNRARDLLARDGYDARVILADPPSTAYRGAAFVAVHADGNGNPAVRGASVGFQTPEGKALAHAWKAAYRQLGWPSGFRGDNYTAALGGYYGVTKAVSQGNRHACIIEAGFLTNQIEAAALRSADGQERCAEAIRRAVNVILGIPRPEPAPQEDDMTAPVLAWLRERPGDDSARHCYRLDGNVASWCPTTQAIDAARFLGAVWWGGSQETAELDPVIWSSLAVMNGPLANIGGV